MTENNPQSTARQPRYSNGFTVIPPNESQRRAIQSTAQREEEAAQRWREDHRMTSVDLTPERLGGTASQAEVRAGQHAASTPSRLQKKMKKEELDKRRRKEEEEEHQKKKDEQRQKAECLEEKRRRDEQRRKEQLRQDHIRVNSAFLDKLQAPGKVNKKETMSEGGGETQRPCLVQNQLFKTKGQQPHLHLVPDPEQCGSSRSKEAGPQTDGEVALMELVNSFPDCSRDVLEDILNQCDGDLQQAHGLLS
ncbi:epithelial-stromal interaction protein 1 [Thalassophryne amazonica]|uniref:epithelial-stromal interaction protein 1 n=1 Tax=Thalassophryne amazonica TaxID=390379 RepID=UPI00147254BE|nr:epithelial-stromal interaction protein 1 [Thalassophryne amazonica]